jgi:signal transduction histidine kinase
LKQTFDAIHNGPLQQLGLMLREAQESPISPPQLILQLKQLNQDLRTVFNSIQQEILFQPERLQFNETDIDLQAPLHDILHLVYEVSLNQMQHYPGLQTIKLKIVSFEPMGDRPLTLAQKRGLGRFLEECLCNVGKHAVGATKLWVFCGQENGQPMIRVADNGTGSTITRKRDASVASGFGSQQAEKLARQLRGTFQRLPNQPQGMVCELRWSHKRHRFW